MSEDFEYDVTLSFAGEQRDYVEAVAAELRSQGVRVFYDNYEQVNLWGKDLYVHLDYIYRKAARYCVLFASADYAKKAWTSHERRSAQARAFEENAEYVLPARFDETEIPGIPPTIGYLHLAELDAKDLADMIVQKIGPTQRSNFFPPDPIALYDALGVHGTSEEQYARDTAVQFFLALRRMTEDERHLLLDLFIEGCASRLPENVHVSLDLLRRANGSSPAEILSTLRGLSSLGILVEEYRDPDHADDNDMIAVSWENRIAYHDEEQNDWDVEYSTQVAREMVFNSAVDRCYECAKLALKNLDFSDLAVAAEHDSH